MAVSANTIPIDSLPSVASTSAGEANAHILVVDDDASIRILLRTFFEKIGYLVSVASNGAEALRYFGHNVGGQKSTNQPVDLVLLDMKMPGMNGIQVCEELRQSSDVPVIVLSGVEEDQTQLSEVGLEIEDFVQKPFRVRDVEDKVQQALNSLATISPQNA